MNTANCSNNLPIMVLFRVEAIFRVCKSRNGFPNCFVARRRGDERFSRGHLRAIRNVTRRSARTLPRGLRRSVAPRRIDRFEPLSRLHRRAGHIARDWRRFRESSCRRHLRDCSDPRGWRVPCRPHSTPRRFVTRSESIRRSSPSLRWPSSPLLARFRRAAAAAAPSRLPPPDPPKRRDICPRRASLAAAPLAPRRSPPPRSNTPSATPPPHRATFPLFTPPCASTSSSSAAASPA